MPEPKPSIGDYAQPLTTAEHAIRDCYEELELRKNLDAAEQHLTTATEALVELQTYIDRKRHQQTTARTTT